MYYFIRKNLFLKYLLYIKERASVLSNLYIYLIINTGLILAPILRRILKNRFCVNIL